MMKPLTRRYLREFVPAMLAYMIVLPISIVLLQQFTMPTAMKVLVVLLPVLPMLLVVRAILRHMLRMDELWQRIQMHAVGVTCGLVGTATFALGFLQGARLVPSFAGEMIWVLPGMLGVWGVATPIISYRYQRD